MVQRKLFSLLFISFCFFISCNSGNKTDTNSVKAIPADSPQMLYAKGFQILKNKEAYTLIIKNPWDSSKVLQKIVLKDSNDCDANSIFFPKEISKLAISNVSDIGYLSLLQAIPNIKASTDIDRIYHAEMKQRIAEQKVIDLGPAVRINQEVLMASNCEALFCTSYSEDLEKQSKLSNIPSIYIMDWMELSPLGRAEWIKVFGVLLGKKEMADSIFNVIEKDYLFAKKEAMLYSSLPTVLVGANYKGIWYMPGGKSFKATLIRDAGGSYPWFHDGSTGSKALNMEEVLSTFRDADIWIEAPFYSKAAMLNSDPLYSHFKAFKTGKVYNNFGSANNLANDYWEKAMAQPNILLRDLTHVLHPNDSDSIILYKKLTN